MAQVLVFQLKSGLKFIYFIISMKVYDFVLHSALFQ